MDGMRTSTQVKDRRRSGALRLAAAALLVAAPSLVYAQGARATADPRWDAWVGCWQAEGASAALPANPAASDLGDAALPAPNAGAPVVCVVPTSDPSTVQVATVSGGKVVSRSEIVANGQQRARTHQGCTGWESAQWSPDGDRVYLRSQDNCPRGGARTSTGVLSMAPDGAWLDVQGVTVSGHTGVRVVRYRSVGVPAALPADLASSLRGNTVARSTARTTASAPITTAEVIEASHRLDPVVTQAWLLASGQRFHLDASQLVALANAGVPGNVTDAMVALAYPKQFALTAQPGAGVAAMARQSGSGALPASAYSGMGRRVPVFVDPYDYSPYGFDAYGYSPYYSPYGYGYSPYGYSPYGYSPYGYSPYGYSPYGAYGYSPYGYGYGLPYGGFYAPPIIVLKGTGGSNTVSGHMVKGRGFVPDYSGSGTRTAQPRSPSYEPPASSTESPPPPPPPPPQRTAHRIP